MSDPVLETVTGTFHICSACLDGAGGECHTPGCVLWINRAPDLAIRDSLQLHGCKVYRLGQEPNSTPPADLGGVHLSVLERIAKYAREDRAVTPGCTRLARALDELDDLARETP